MLMQFPAVAHRLDTLVCRDVMLPPALRLALVAEMPVIPLWQLDPLLVIHDHLKTVPFDPWLVFTDVEQWRLEQK